MWEKKYRDKFTSKIIFPFTQKTPPTQISLKKKFQQILHKKKYGNEFINSRATKRL